MSVSLRHPEPPARCYHLWPHGARVLDLGDDAHVAAQLRDFAAHDYVLRGVRLRGAGAVDVVAYYDGQHQSALTREQLDLVRAWVRRCAAPRAGSAAATAEDGPFSTSSVADVAEPGRATSVAADAPAADAPEERAAVERVGWLVLALVPAVLALAFVAYAVGRSGGATRDGGPALVSAAATLALVSAVITWHRTRGSGLRAAVRPVGGRSAGVRHARQAGGVPAAPRA